jgi:AraC-like DNA-binding protein
MLDVICAEAAAAMLDFSRLPSLTPEMLFDSAPLPPPTGPVRYALGDRPERERPALLRECLARLGFRYEVNAVRGAPCDVDLSLNMLPDLLMAVGRMHGTRNRRTRAHVEDDTDDAVLIVNIRGAHLIEQRGKELVLGDGDAVFVSGADPSSFTHRPPGELLAFRFPKARFAPLLRDRDDCYMRRIPSGTQALCLLRSYTALAWDERMTASPELQHLMVSHVYDLMAVMAGTGGEAGEVAHARGVRAARLAAIKRDIAGSLDQPDLSVAALAERHRCTERFVQRLFEAEGTTFTQYVLGQRLARAHDLLADPCWHAEKISTVAYDCGFGDVSYFNRTFRKLYGVAPSDVRAGALRAARLLPSA